MGSTPTMRPINFVDDENSPRNNNITLRDKVDTGSEEPDEEMDVKVFS